MNALANARAWAVLRPDGSHYACVTSLGLARDLLDVVIFAGPRTRYAAANAALAAGWRIVECRLVLEVLADAS